MGDVQVQQQQINPHKVTKPIQLLAAWMVGLILTNASFLGAAMVLADQWGRDALIVASIINVPLFLLALFVLQTKFRAELQEDTYYSEYLSKKSSAVVRIDKNSAQDAKIEAIERQINSLVLQSSQALYQLPSDSRPLDWTDWAVALHAKHPDFTKIRNSLRDADIPLAEIFGVKGKLPDEWIISIDVSLPFPHRVRLLQALIPFKFDGFLFWEPAVDAGEDENVYIGSYGGDTWAQITDDLRNLLAGPIEPFDLKAYIETHTQTSPD